MRYWDRIQMSISSLFRRKLRTVLTVLGVVIGIASIVTMLGLGEGESKKMMDQFEEYSSIKEITVNENYNNAGGKNGNSLKGKLTEDAVEEISRLEHVVNVRKILVTDVTLKTGTYESYCNLIAMPMEDMKKKNWKFAEGDFPEPGSKFSIIYGNSIISDFAKPGKPPMYYMTGEVPNINLMKDAMFVTFNNEYSASPQSTADGSEGQGADGSSGQTRKPKKYSVPAAGVLEGDIDDYHEYSYSIYCDQDELLAFYKKNYGKGPYPGQPARKDGKPFKQIVYTELWVEVDDINNVEILQQDINDLGYQSYSDKEWILQQQDAIRSMEAMLGGIGAIALLVAAIGIANTMMMSIYERTKEIGVMKVLGCHLKVIRSLFLIEAALIGVIGGVLGVGLSYLVGFIINKLTEPKTVVIQPQLVLLGMAFAVGMSILAGYIPSKRAMLLSPLAALRNE